MWCEQESAKMMMERTGKSLDATNCHFSGKFFNLNWSFISCQQSILLLRNSSKLNEILNELWLQRHGKLQFFSTCTISLIRTEPQINQSKNWESFHFFCKEKIGRKMTFLLEKVIKLRNLSLGFVSPHFNFSFLRSSKKYIRFCQVEEVFCSL